MSISACVCTWIHFFLKVTLQFELIYESWKAGSNGTESPCTLYPASCKHLASPSFPKYRHKVKAQLHLHRTATSCYLWVTGLGMGTTWFSTFIHFQNVWIFIENLLLWCWRVKCGLKTKGMENSQRQKAECWFPGAWEGEIGSCCLMGIVL